MSFCVLLLLAFAALVVDGLLESEAALQQVHLAHIGGAVVDATFSDRGHRLFVASTGGVVSALDATSGAIVWRHVLADASDTFESVVVGERALLGVVASRTFRVLDAASGALVWSATRVGAVELHATPAAMAFASNDDVVFVWDSELLYAHSLANKASRVRAWQQSVPLLSAVVEARGNALLLVVNNVVSYFYILLWGFGFSRWR